MCYDFKAQLITQLKRAMHHRDDDAVRIIQERLKKLGAKDYYHTMGMDHPAILIYTKEAPNDPILAKWGFIRDTVGGNRILDIWRQPWSLNAVGEEMFEKWTYKEAAKNKRCLICIDGFFEHYHHQGETYPHYIYTADNEPMTLAGLWSEWKDKESGRSLTTFSIVTSATNELMKKIHNNPKAPNGPRMPLILSEDEFDDWLNLDGAIPAERERLLKMVKPYTRKPMDAHTVGRIRGKRRLGNVDSVTAKATYPNLGAEFDPYKGNKPDLLF